MAKLSREDKIDHIKKCEFHRRTKEGECPTVSNAEAELLIASLGISKENLEDKPPKGIVTGTWDFKKSKRNKSREKRR